MIDRKEMKKILQLQDKPLEDYLKIKSKEDLINIILEWSKIKTMGEELLMQNFPQLKNITRLELKK